MQMMDRKALLGALLAICFLPLGCGGGNGANNSSLSGIQGKATKSPISPVVREGQLNEAPLPGVSIVVTGLNGAEVARQTTDAQGDYKIGLAPGNYTVVGLPLDSASILPVPESPKSVTVASDKFLTVNISYDTGIR